MCVPKVATGAVGTLYLSVRVQLCCLANVYACGGLCACHLIELSPLPGKIWEEGGREGGEKIGGLVFNGNKTEGVLLQFIIVYHYRSQFVHSQ